MELLIVRHARPIRQHAEDGAAADPPLAESGRVQAEATAEFLSSEGIDSIASSTMKRALQTADPLAERLGMAVTAFKDLRESDHRSSVYVPTEEMSRDDPSTAHYFDPGLSLHDTVFSDGYDAFRHRVVSVFDHLIAANRSRTVAVFCHGVVTGVYLQTVLGFDDPFSLLVDYCGISRVVASSTGKRSVLSVNETAHLRHLPKR